MLGTASKAIDVAQLMISFFFGGGGRGRVFCLCVVWFSLFVIHWGLKGGWYLMTIFTHNFASSFGFRYLIHETVFFFSWLTIFPLFCFLINYTYNLNNSFQRRPSFTLFSWPSLTFLETKWGFFYWHIHILFREVKSWSNLIFLWKRPNLIFFVFCFCFCFCFLLV